VLITREDLAPGVWWWSSSDGPPVADLLPSEVFVIPSGCPTLSTLSGYAHASMMLGFRGSSAGFEPTRRALRTSELPDRLHRRQARLYSSLNRFSLWLAIAGLTKAPVLVVEEQAFQGRDGRTAGRLIQEASGRHHVIFVMTLSSSWAEACGAVPWPIGTHA
jgi:hypothetical protein